MRIPDVETIRKGLIDIAKEKKLSSSFIDKIKEAKILTRGYYIKDDGFTLFATEVDKLLILVPGAPAPHNELFVKDREFFFLYDPKDHKRYLSNRNFIYVGSLTNICPYDKVTSKYFGGMMEEVTVKPTKTITLKNLKATKAEEVSFEEVSFEKSIENTEKEFVYSFRKLNNLSKKDLVDRLIASEKKIQIVLEAFSKEYLAFQNGKTSEYEKQIEELRSEIEKRDLIIKKTEKEFFALNEEYSELKTKMDNLKSIFK